MSKQLQLIYDEVAEKKQKIKELRQMLKDALAQDQKYQELAEEIEDLRFKKKMIETAHKVELGKAFEEFEELSDEIKDDKERMNDEALNNLMAGKTVSVKDAFDNEYEPKWSVKFIRK